MPKKTVAALREETVQIFPPHGLINANNLCRAYARATGRLMPPYLSYRTQQSGRAWRSAAWQVVRPGLQTDPDAHWSDYGCKTFTVFGRDEKAPQLDAARAWASERYGVAEWKKTNRLRLHGDWFPAEVVDWLEAEIKRRLSAMP